jgi:1-acyl-sn-glycerol-3-phosphate acyltransferase
MLARIASELLLFVATLITGAQGRWRGCAPEAQQRIYFANHQSHLDMVMIWAALPPALRLVTRPIAAKDYWTSSALKHWITSKVFNAVYVNRQRSDDQDPLEPLIEVLRNGQSLVIFPEGTRGFQEDPMPFKSGLFHLSEHFPDIDMIPAWIENVQRVMPKGTVIPVPMLCSVTFGAPIRRHPGEDKREFLERARAAVMALRGH